MLDVTEHHDSVSHTRAASLANLAGLCVVLRMRTQPLSVTMLAQAAINQAIFEEVALSRGSRLPTRINHHMIALRELALVISEQGNNHVWYRLTPAGEVLADVAGTVYSGQGPLYLNDVLREAWRPVLVHSDYVRHQWLKYFMPRADFTYPEFLSDGVAVAIYRLPMTLRDDDHDSGYRIASEYWGERGLDDVERREVYEGLRRWTNNAYLTDDRLPPDRRGPFLHLGRHGDDVFENESHVVRAWLSPDENLDLFEQRIREVLERREGGNRISIPELIIAMCDDYDYAKANVREMLIALYDERGDDYYFERASAFLIRHAFGDVRKANDYYVQIEGVWRTGLVCYQEGMA